LAAIAAALVGPNCAIGHSVFNDHNEAMSPTAVPPRDALFYVAATAGEAVAFHTGGSHDSASTTDVSGRYSGSPLRAGIAGADRDMLGGGDRPREAILHRSRRR
jgi:hypothetical protein